MSARTDRLRSALRAVWARSDLLFDTLRPEALALRPIALRHPFVFYLGHLPAFAWNQVARGVLGRPPFDPTFDRLFERGIDPADEAAAAVHRRDAWPARAAIEAYRDGVRAALLEAVDAVLARAADDVLAARGRVVRLVVEHEAMHHETLLYMIQALDHAAKRPPRGWSLPPDGATPSPAQIAVPAGRTVLGADFDALDYGWDNEFPATPVDVAAFAIDARPVTNEAFAAFVDAGGYADDASWGSAGAAWRRAAGVVAPLGWRGEGTRRVVRAAYADVPFARARAWPVQVSWAEADAYARWRGRRLPTEAEVHRAAYGSPLDAPRAYPWGDVAPDVRRANLGFARWTPEPVGRRPGGASAWGVEELVGNGWEWTSTVFAGHPGFSPWARTYPGYSADFFDGHHRVLLGASWATDVGLVRRSFRNWFQPHYPYVFAKFRTVAS